MTYSAGRGRPQRLFAYGTLQSGECRNGFLVAGRIRSVLAARAPGKLFDFGEYPGMRLSVAGGEVVGEVIEFEDLDRILPELDEEEGPEYQREMIEVRLEVGGTVEAWAYVLISEPIGAAEIAAGDWKKRKHG
jgi:gamma-glutamylcyclotransferase (GGCT)/AIG2-like uncharacterized protein YtfP